MSSLDDQKQIDEYKVPEVVPNSCKECKYFKKTGIIDIYKGHCTFYDKDRFSNWSCLAQELISSEELKRGATSITSPQEGENIKNKSFHEIGLIGAIILCLGVFTPIYYVPHYGNLNFFPNYKIAGGIIIFSAVISSFLIIKKRWVFGGLCLTSLASVGAMILTFADIANMIEKNKAGKFIIILPKIKTEQDFRRFIDELSSPTDISFQWGWFVLVAGVVLLFSAAVIKEINKP